MLPARAEHGESRGPHTLSADLSRAIEDERRRGGSPLPRGPRHFMESRLGADFGAVRVHRGRRATRLNAHLASRAFTVGRDVFFGQGEFRPESHEGRELLAHELVHTIQQGAVRQSQTGPRTAPRVVTATSEVGQVQMLGLGDAVSFFADRANLLPGFRMMTVILGANPIDGRRVERSAANVLRAVLELVPGATLLTGPLAEHGLFDRAGAFVEERVAQLASLVTSIRGAVTQFLDELSWTDAFDLSGLWARAQRLVTEPITGVRNFVGGLVSTLTEMVRVAIRQPLAAMAAQTHGYGLLRALLGRDPISGEAHPRTVESVVGALMHLVGREDVWNNIVAAGALGRAQQWFGTALDTLMGFAAELPLRVRQTIAALSINDLIAIPRTLTKVAGIFVGFVGHFVDWGATAVWDLLEIVFEVLAPGLLTYLRRAGGALRSILDNPVRFVGHLMRAATTGFRAFATNIVQHLQGALLGWLTGALEGTGVHIPTALTFAELLKFVLSVLGLTWQNIRGKLVRAVGERAVSILETTTEVVVRVVREGPGALWELLREHLTNLRDTVLQGVIDFVSTRIVQAAVVRIVSMLNPAGAVVQAILAIYNTVMFFVERMRQITSFVASVIDSLAAIANGVIAPAAERIEQSLASGLTMALSFLARLIGLGGVGEAIGRILERIRAPIDRALDAVVAWIVRTAGRLVQGVRGAAARTVQWWAQRVAIRAGEESHHLQFQGEGHGARLLIASRPRPLSEFVEKKAREVSGSPKQMILISKIRAGMTSLQADLDRVDEAPQPEAKHRSIEKRMNCLGALLQQLLTIDEWGTRANPLPIDYQKRRATAFPVIYLTTDPAVPVGQKDRRRLYEVQSENERTVFQYRPTMRKQLPNNGGKIGISSSNQVEVGRKIQYDDKEARASAVGQFKTLLKPFGYVASHYGLDIDHVVELQIGGHDETKNLWPLPQGENRSSGSLIKNTKLQLPDGTQKPVQEARANKGSNGELWLIVVSTRQR